MNACIASTATAKFQEAVAMECDQNQQLEPLRGALLRQVAVFTSNPLFLMAAQAGQRTGRFDAFRKAATNADAATRNTALFALIVAWVKDKKTDSVSTKHYLEILLREFDADAGCFRNSALLALVKMGAYTQRKYRADLFELLIRHGAQETEEMRSLLVATNDAELLNVLRRYGHLSVE